MRQICQCPKCIEYATCDAQGAAYCGGCYRRECSAADCRHDLPERFSFIGPSGKVVTAQGVAKVDLRRLDAMAEGAYVIGEAFSIAMALRIGPPDYRPTLTVAKERDDS